MAKCDGPQSALVLIDTILVRDDVVNYHLAHAARTDLCRRPERTAEARVSYKRALSFTEHELERRVLKR